MAKIRNVPGPVGCLDRDGLGPLFPARIGQEFGNVKQLLSEYLSAALGLGVALNSQQIPDASCPFPKSCGHLSQS